MRKVHWSALAATDLRNIRQYTTDTQSAKTAQRTVDRIVLTTDNLLDHPRAGPSIAYLDWRKWRVTGLPFVLIYRSLSTGIEILRIRHAAEDWQAE